MAFVPAAGVGLGRLVVTWRPPVSCKRSQQTVTVGSPAMSGSHSTPVYTRRSALAAAAAAAGAAAVAAVSSTLVAPLPAYAAEVQPYKDIAKGFSILRPTAWNEFDASEGQYDVKWQDIIQPLEFITVLTSPVAKGRSVADIGAVDQVGGKIASSRGGQLLAAVETAIEGVPAYLFEIRKGPSHQLTLLTITKSKLYSVNACASEQRWPRREKLLRSVVESFRPKL